MELHTLSHQEAEIIYCHLVATVEISQEMFYLFFEASVALK